MGDLVKTNICSFTGILGGEEFPGVGGLLLAFGISCNFNQSLSNQTLKRAKFEYFQFSASLCLPVMLVKKPCVDHCNRQMPEQYNIPVTGPDGKFTECKMLIQLVNYSHGSVELLDGVRLINVGVLFFGLVPVPSFSQKLRSRICWHQPAISNKQCQFGLDSIILCSRSPLPIISQWGASKWRNCQRKSGNVLSLQANRIALPQCLHRLPTDSSLFVHCHHLFPDICHSHAGGLQQRAHTLNPHRCAFPLMYCLMPPNVPLYSTIISLMDCFWREAVVRHCLCSHPKMVWVSKGDRFLLRHWPFRCLQSWWQRVAGWIGYVCHRPITDFTFPVLRYLTDPILRYIIRELVFFFTFPMLSHVDIKQTMHGLVCSTIFEHTNSMGMLLPMLSSTYQGKLSVESKPVACLSWHPGTTQPVLLENSRQGTQNLSFPTC